MLGLVNYLATWVICCILPSEVLPFPMEYFQNALENHPRTRRFMELVSDTAYPISSYIIGSGVVPFCEVLRRGVNSLKQMSDYVFQPPYITPVWQIDSEALQPSKTRLREEMPSVAPDDEDPFMPGGASFSASLNYDSGSSSVTSSTCRSPSPNITKTHRIPEPTLEGPHIQSILEEVAALTRGVASLNTRVEYLVLRITKEEFVNGDSMSDDTGLEPALAKLPVSVMRGAGEEAEVASETNTVIEMDQILDNPRPGYIVDFSEEAGDAEQGNQEGQQLAEEDDRYQVSMLSVEQDGERSPVDEAVSDVMDSNSSVAGTDGDAADAAERRQRSVKDILNFYPAPQSSPPLANPPPPYSRSLEVPQREGNYHLDLASSDSTMTPSRSRWSRGVGRVNRYFRQLNRADR